MNKTTTQTALISPNDLHMAPASKVKPLKAKPINSLLVDPSVASKFLLDTLEGTQMLKANSMICIGEHNDIWQQDKKKLLAKYTVVEITDDGWMVCNPKPENVVDVAQITPLDIPLESGVNFAIKGQWGERQSDGTFVQYGKIGDYVARSQSDPTDVWIIAKKIFENTYKFNE